MKNLKTVCKKFLFLRLWLVIILTLMSAALLIMIFIKGWDSKPVAYAVYVFSFYTLTVLCIFCAKTMPGCYKSIKGRVYANPYANRYLTDAVYKTHVSLDVSLAINLLYVATNAVSAIIYRTSWFAIFAIYYGTMAVMRFLLVRYVGKNHIGESRLGELKRSRTCACILMTINFALSGAVLMMVYYDMGFEYKGFLIYVMALHTFYTTTAAVMDLIKYRRYKSPVMSTSKIIKLAQSMFSMLFLETAMFSQFGQEASHEFKRIMIMVTGAGIGIMVVSMSVYMIVRSSKEIREYKKKVKEQQQQIYDTE